MSAAIRVSHWTELPLSAGGRALVEASAGTGKTWTIGVLYLRLLLEGEAPPGVANIVVTTFTDAASQELRERLRGRLQRALARSEGIATGTPDAADTWLQDRWGDAATLALDRRRLRLALADFDRAPIGTLHRLCRRILAEFPLEAGTGFEAAEATAGDALLEELARDAWRVLHQGEDLSALEQAGLQDLKLSTFTRTLERLLRPGVRIEAEGPDETELRSRLPADFAERLRAVVDTAGLFQPRKTALANALRALAAWVEDDAAALKDSALDNLRRFDVEGQVRAEAADAFVAHPAIQEARALLHALLRARELPRLRFWRDQAERIAGWREQRLLARGQTTFDDMLRRAHAAVLSRQALADALFAEWPVALVDEFQDTDAIQYGLLDRLYRAGDGALRGRLVMIGDPKQAIYGFRGGDPQAYRRARADAGHQLVLDTNFRSSRALVRAVNGFYAAAGPALGQRPGTDIAYLPVQASDRQDPTPYEVDGEEVDRPLVLHHLPEEQDPGDQPGRQRLALRACADQIAQMLAAGTHTLGGRALQPGDIAVLLPRNQDVNRLRRLLQARGVPCVGAARDSVFAGDWAFELQVVLQALADDTDDGALRAALLTRLWGGSLASLAALEDDARAWDGLAARRRSLQATWRREGVLALVQRLAQQAAPRLLASATGERDLTDLRHLGELLQQQAQVVAGPRELLAWLADQRRGEDQDEAAEERQLRIESDARRVQLLTLHRSKGLEFPVVMLPLMWSHAGKAPEVPALVVDGEAPGRVASYDAQALADAAWDAQDERFRVLYVALTRAVHACHVYAMAPERPAAKGRSAATDPLRSALDATLLRIDAAGDIGPPAWCWALGWPLGDSPVAPVPAPVPGRIARPLPPPPPPRQRLSFSALVGALRGGHEEAPADDEAEAEAEAAAPAAPSPPHPELQALAGLRGIAFGNAVHALFETRAPGAAFADDPRRVERGLQDHGVRADRPLAELAAILARRLDGSLQAALQPGLALADLAPARQRVEMAFHFALDGARVAALRAACADHGEPGLVPALTLDRLRGLMTGKIDLVFEHAGRFHVLDYKGNWLGDTLADYEGAALRAAMDASHYRLQALIYTVALHRLLAQRLRDYAPARHLGGFFYLYLRAAGLAPGAGVYHERFDEDLLAAVDAALSVPEAAPA